MEERPEKRKRRVRKVGKKEEKGKSKVELGSKM
jgi:hypothetical protein